MSAKKIAERLTRGQQSTVLGLDERFCVLGCSEPTAIRLCSDGIRRPALVKEGSKQGGYRTFALTELGLAVKEALQ